MASITKRIALTVDADAAWEAVRDVGHPDLLFAGVLTDAHLDGDLRVVTFASGTVVSERIIDIDDDARRFVYAVVDGPFVHHQASFTVSAEADGTSTLTWVTDLLPDNVAPMVEGLMEQGAAAAVATLGG
jgi:hypothetical protein